MISASPHQYLREGSQLGVSPESLKEALRQAERVERRGMSAVLTLTHLAVQVGVEVAILRGTVERVRDPYRSFSIKKRDGKSSRRISIPSPTIMRTQKWILGNILNYQTAHSRSFAYEQRRSIRDCAQMHCGAKWLLKLDMHDFFHTITEKSVYKVFLDAGYNPLVSFELARLCTRQIGEGARRSGVAPLRYSITDYHSDYLGFLPQGAPTSGKLANLCARALDEEICRIASHSEVVYTRYADDLTFSGSGKFSRPHVLKLLRNVDTAVWQNGFRLHKKKTRITPPGARKLVLGLSVEEAQPRLSVRTKQNIDTHIRGCKKFGITPHRRVRHFTSTWSFIAHLWGLLSFAQSIEPEWTTARKVEWDQILSRDGWASNFRPDIADL